MDRNAVHSKQSFYLLSSPDLCLKFGGIFMPLPFLGNTNCFSLFLSPSRACLGLVPLCAPEPRAFKGEARRNWTEVPGRSTWIGPKWKAIRPEVQVFLLPTCWNPGGSRCFPTERAWVCRLGPSSRRPHPRPLQTSCQLNRGPREKGRSREKAARGKRFQIPPSSLAPDALGSWGGGG